jgi:colanic acid/amylovoran biosynthesis protein
MKILFMNTCILNNGDALLVTGLYHRLKKDGHRMILSDVRDMELCKKKYPHIRWMRGITSFNWVEQKLIKISPIIKVLIIKCRALLTRRYGKFDIILSAPGGYINKFYGFEDRMMALQYLKQVHDAKLVMYSQSVGPLKNSDEEILHKYIKEFALFMVRDKYSHGFVSQYNNVLLTNDAAFLNKPHMKWNKESKMIGISVREWNYDGASERSYIDMMIRIIKFCIDRNYLVEFVSTCQGNVQYIDDSKMAEKIVKRLGMQYREKIKINNQQYTIAQLKNKISDFYCVIGTRLHMCILSLLTGIPAFNISYEMKGIECYKQLEMEAYSCNYNESIEKAISKMEVFMDKIPEISNRLEDKMEKMNHLAEESYEMFMNTITEEKDDEDNKNKIC